MAVLDADSNGEIQFATTKATALLCKYFGPGFSARLPPRLLQWAGAQQVGLRGFRPSITMQLGPGDLYIRLTGRIDGSLQLLLEEKCDDSARLQVLGLTPREAEVLLWIARGKRSREIATILSCSPATISKHVQRILTKLGVETRTAAAAIAAEFGI